MAASALDILPLDLMRKELRIPDGVSTQDDLLERQIESAVSYCQVSLRAPLVDVTDAYRLEPAKGMGELVFAAPEMKAVIQILYWTPSGSKIDDPDGVVLPADLGRIVKRRFDWQTHSISPPATGWPETLPGTLFELTLTRGIDIDAKTAALRQAVILLVRQLYDGYRQIRSNEAFLRILQPFKSRGFVSRRGEVSPSLQSWLEWNR